MEAATSFSLHSEAMTESVLEALRSRGWSLEDNGHLRAVIQIQTALSDDRDPLSVADAVEAELLNMDLRSVGSKSLPDTKTLSRKTSYLQGPTVLQVLAVRDLSVSKEEGGTGSGKRRLLRFVLTDGKSEIVAVEFSPLRCITTDVVPGTKVRLENKVPIRSGFFCLDDGAITLLGGVVQTLYDEWQMNRKYSGFSRSSLRLPQQGETEGPPPFEKLRIRESSHLSSWDQGLSGYHEFTYKSGASTSARGGGGVGNRQMDAQARLNNTDSRWNPSSVTDRGEAASSGNAGYHEFTYKSSASTSARGGGVVGNRQIDAQARLNNIDSRWNPSSVTDRGEAASSGNEERPTSMKNEGKTAVVEDKGKASLTGETFKKVPSPSETRPRDVAEAIPVQNQDAAQKLLHKMNNTVHRGLRHKGWKHRGIETEEREVFTLDEWEKRKTSAKPTVSKGLPDTSHDEDLAWQLQNQLEMEDSHVQKGTRSVADDLKQSMFGYGREADMFEGAESGGRGRGRRGRSSGRGRGRRGGFHHR